MQVTSRRSGTAGPRDGKVLIPPADFKGQTQGILPQVVGLSPSHGPAAQQALDQIPKPLCPSPEPCQIGLRRDVVVLEFPSWVDSESEWLAEVPSLPEDSRQQENLVPGPGHIPTQLPSHRGS